MKKLISLALISAMLLTFTACDKKENSSDTSTENSQSGQTSNSESSSTSSEPVSTPGSGWTVEAAVNAFCIDGKPIPYPFTVDALGKEYSVKKDETKISDDGLASTILYKNGKPFLDLNFQGVKNFKQLSSSNVKAIGTYWRPDISDEDYKYVMDSFSINGIRLGASHDEVIGAFGEPDVDHGYLVGYLDKNSGQSCVIFSFNEDGILYSFSLYNLD